MDKSLLPEESIRDHAESGETYGTRLPQVEFPKSVCDCHPKVNENNLRLFARDLSSYTSYPILRLDMGSCATMGGTEGTVFGHCSALFPSCANC